MPWVSTRELRRIERERQCSEQRALVAEQRLEVERDRRDRKELQLLDRAVTKHGGYGLDREPKMLEPPKGRPDGFTREPTELDLIRLAQYEKWAGEAGIANPNEDARARWEAEMRGEMIYSPDEPM